MSQAQRVGRGGALRPAGLLSRGRVALLVVVLVWALSFAVLLAKTVPVSGDGIYYFVQLESIVRDGDLDFANNLQAFKDNPHVAKQLDSGVTTPTGRTPNLFSVGPALLWSPVYLIVLALPLTGDTARSAELLAPSTATSIYVLVGLVALFATCRRLGIGRWPALLATVATFIGTNLIYYSTFEASMSHGLGFALVSLLVWMSVRYRESPRLRYWLATGLLAGLATTVRWQLILVAVAVPGVDLARHTLRGRPGRALAFVAGLAVGVLPQLIVWKRLYGSWLTIPQGSGFIDWTSPHFGEVLVSSRHGLLIWTPLVVLGVAGLLILARNPDRRRRHLAVAGVLALVMQVYLNGTLLEWWGGDAFGARRFTDVMALMGVGLAALFAMPRWRLKIAALALTTILVAGNLAFMQFYRHDLISRSEPVSLHQLVEAWRAYKR